MSITVVSDKAPEQGNAPRVSKRRLADRINRLNFLGQRVRVQLFHPRYEFALSIQALPQPCDGETLELHWVEPLPDNIYQYNITGIVLPGDPSAFSVSIENFDKTSMGISCALPLQGISLPERKSTRYQSLKNIKATLTQNSACLAGTILDFSAHSLCIKTTIEKPHSRHWIVTERQAHLTLENDHGVIFSGAVEVIRSDEEWEQQTFVVAPVNSNMPRFTTRRYRPDRVSLFPEPTLSLLHPLTGRHIELNISNLSGLGLCVEEAPDQAMFLPGMVLPLMHIKLLTGFSISCRGQVVYSNLTNDPANGSKCGIAILDIDIQAHLRLLSLLQRAKNRNAHLCSEVDIDALWEFFFETGFIYPSKYRQLAQRKDGFFDTFRKTYLDQTSITRHFTFQSDGQIMAHLSAIRLYEKTWLQQHHAARRSGKHAVGLEVLQQLADYFYNAFLLNHDKVGYVTGFYRPENRFPSKYFRSIVEYLGNKKAASLDMFTYFESVPSLKGFDCLTDKNSSWRIESTTKGDLIEFNGFYEKISGGCMVDALCLKPEMLGRTEIEEEYKKLGLKRKRHLYSIKQNKELMALIELHESNTELSLSRMDRVITAYVLREELPLELLCTLTQTLVRKLNLDNPPMMIFPSDYIVKHGHKADKRYEMMILNMFHSEKYMHFLDNFIEKHQGKG